MRFAAAALAFSLLSVGSIAVAQPKTEMPADVAADQEIELAVGEAKTLKFKRAFQSAGVVTKDVAQVAAQSDHTVTVSGLAPGETLMIVYDTDGNPMYRAAIVVNPGKGSLVRIYGHDNKDYRGFYCSSTGCGRVDLDKNFNNGGRDPDEPVQRSITVTQPAGRGGSVSSTSTYRR